MGKLERQRARIVEMLEADPERSARSIAAEVRCSPHTVIRQRKLHVQSQTADSTENGTVASARPTSTNLMPPAEPGNTRSVKSGRYSERMREPLEERHREQLRLAHPAAPESTLRAMATRLAIIDLLSAWCADAGVVHPRKGLPEVSPAARELRLLLRDHESALQALEAREREGGSGRQSLAEIEAELAEDEIEDVEGVVDEEGTR